MSTTTNNEPLGGDLHAAIMNLPCRAATADLLNPKNDSEVRAYQVGHRDARHAAAELVAAAESGQQVPVGETVDTPTFRRLLRNVWLRSSMSNSRLSDEETALIAHITAWKDAQLARERQGHGEPAVWARRHPDGTITSECIPNSAIEQVRKDSGAWVPLYFTPAPQAQGEPVAVEYKPLTRDEVLTLMLKNHLLSKSGEKALLNGEFAHVNMDFLSLLVDKARRSVAAPQADEVRDAARYRWLRNEWDGTYHWKDMEALRDGGADMDATIDAAMRTTAANNQKGE